MGSISRKAEAALIAYMEGAGKGEAFMIGYPASANWSAKVVGVKSCEFFKRPAVVARLAELQERVMKKHDVTVASLLEELEEARQAALTAETPQSSAAVGATMGKAKLCGLDKQIVEVSGSLSVRTKMSDFYD